MAGGLDAQLAEIFRNAKRFGDTLEKTLPKVVSTVGTEIRDRSKKRFAPGKLGDPGQADERDQHGLLPHRQTGALSRAIVKREEIGDGFAETIVFTTEVVASYAATVEQGGEVRAKKGRFLAIPLNRKARRLQVRAGGSLRGVTSPRLFFIDLGGGAFFLAAARRDKAQRGKGLEFLFRLVKSVRVRPHPYLRPALLDSRAGFERAAAGLARLFG